MLSVCVILGMFTSLSVGDLWRMKVLTCALVGMREASSKGWGSMSPARLSPCLLVGYFHHLQKISYETSDLGCMSEMCMPGRRVCAWDVRVISCLHLGGMCMPRMCAQF